MQRLRAPLTGVGSDMLSVGNTGDPALTERLGHALGSELAALGIGWDFAPVLDVHTNPQNPVIGNRAFGTTPEAVALHALAFWRGLTAAGLIGSGKHFPGHGNTHADSHFTLPVDPHDIDRLRAVELAPFAAAARAGIDSIMTAHVIYPALDRNWPATLSPRILTEILRGELGFTGVIVSDDLGMKAVADRYPIEEIAVSSIAGRRRPFVDPRVARAPARGVRCAGARRPKARAEIRARAEQSAARVLQMKAKARVGMPAPEATLPSLLGTESSKEIAAAIKRGSAPASSPAARSPVADVR